MKTCTRCLEIKPIDDFWNATKTKDGKTYNCKTCMQEISKVNRARCAQLDAPEHNLTGYTLYKCRCEVCSAANTAWHQAHRETRVDLISQIKLERGCADCGYKDYACVLQFDHLNEGEKEFQISLNYTVSLERLLGEIAKCDVVCSNCHAIRTAQRAGTNQRRYGFWEEDNNVDDHL